MDDSTFTTPPSSDVDFSFDFNSNSAEAMAMLEADSNLSIKRFKLVPRKVKEDAFWRNYFYRVYLIRESHEGIEDNDGGDESGDEDEEAQLLHMNHANDEASRIARADTDELLGDDDHDDDAGLNFASEDPLLALDAAAGDDDDALDPEWEASLQAELGDLDGDLDDDLDVGGIGEDLEERIKAELQL